MSERIAPDATGMPATSEGAKTPSTKAAQATPGAVPTPRPMRRHRRAVTEAANICGIVERCRTVRLGLADAQGPFVVPLSFGYDWACAAGSQPQLTLWLHCAHEGRKLDAIAADPLVAFELDAELGVIGGSFACAYSLAYESVMGTGLARVATSPAEKLHGLSRIMEHMAPGAPTHFSEAAIAETTILAIEARELSAKRRLD